MINHRENSRRSLEPQERVHFPTRAVFTDDLKVNPVRNYQPAPGHRDPGYLWSQKYPRALRNPREPKDPEDLGGLWSPRGPREPGRPGWLIPLSSSGSGSGLHLPRRKNSEFSGRCWCQTPSPPPVKEVMCSMFSMSVNVFSTLCRVYANSFYKLYDITKSTDNSPRSATQTTRVQCLF